MRARHWLTGLTAAALMALPVSSAAGLTLVKDGAPVSVIVIADPAPEAAKVGAEELQYHLKKMSGATVPIVTSDQAPADGAAMVLIGKSPQTDALGIDPSGLAPEGYMIKTVGNALVIVGDDAKDPAAALRKAMSEYHGSLMGVYALLEDQFGCHWIWPGEIGEYVPARATVEIGDLDIVDEPALQRRHIRLVLNKGVGPSGNENLIGSAALEQLKTDETVWYRRMRLGRSAQPPRGHSFTDWYEKYKDTPDSQVFALLPNGTRGPADVKRPKYMKMCVANPRFWEMQLEQFKAQFERNPNNHLLSCCENDGSSGFCTCDLCKAWDATTENLPEDVLNDLDPNLYERLTPRKDGLPTSLSTRYAKWYNELARRVKEIDPDGIVTAYAYTRYRDMPIDVKLEPNMIVGYVGFNGYPRTPAQRALDRRDYMAYAQPGIKLYIRPNLPHYTGNGHPYNVARDAAEDLQFVMAHGTYMTDYDSMNGYWAAWGPTFYVLPRLMWEGPEASIEQVIDEWYNAFGPAERKVRDYYDFWEKYIYWIKTAPDGQERRSVEDVYSQDIIDQARELLDQAVEAGANADDGVKARIENVAMCLRNTELTVNALKLAAKPTDVEENKTALKAALVELNALRRSIAPRNVVNVYKLTDGEMNRGGYWKGAKLPWDIIADVQTQEGELLID
jgi:hypothetical protein